MQKYISILVQIIAGLVLTYVIYIISLYIVNSDKLAVMQRQHLIGKSEVKIIKGVLNSSEVAANSENNSWNTTLPFLKNFLPLNPSMNMLGGAQFSYSFWINVDNPIDVLNKTIFMKGDIKNYKYKVDELDTTFNNSTVVDPSTITIVDTQIKSGRAIFCPMLKFGGSPMEFDLKFNTFHRMHEEVQVRRSTSENSLLRNNLPGLLSKNWFMITITFEDNFPILDFERGIFIRIYINDTLYQMEKIPSVLRQNRGNFHLLPTQQPMKGLKIADFSYFNYALSDQEVRKRSLIAPNVKASASQTHESKSFDTVAQNDMDIYNTAF